MITQFQYYNSLSQFIKLNFNNIIQLGTNENVLFHNLCQFCKNDYEIKFNYDDYNLCYYNYHNIKKINKNKYLVNNLIVYCTDKNYIKYLDFIQQICKKHFYLAIPNKSTLTIKFVIIPYNNTGQFRKIENDNYIFINKKFKLGNKRVEEYNEFIKFYVLFHEYLHFLLSSYNLYGLFEEGLIELLINQDLKIKCYCQKWIKLAFNLPEKQRNTFNIYQLLKIWVFNILNNTKLINSSYE